jgi:hypothetical protein
MTASPSLVFHALIQTHHITSRKKVAHLRKATEKNNCYTLLRSGGTPGIMYCRGSEEGVREWVAAVQRLRYKDFHLAAKPASIDIPHASQTQTQSQTQIQSNEPEPETGPGLFETTSVNDFAKAMKKLGISAWWKHAMGFG